MSNRLDRAARTDSLSSRQNTQARQAGPSFLSILLTRRFPTLRAVQGVGTLSMSLPASSMISLAPRVPQI